MSGKMWLGSSDATRRTNEKDRMSANSKNTPNHIKQNMPTRISVWRFIYFVADLVIWVGSVMMWRCPTQTVVWTFWIIRVFLLCGNVCWILARKWSEWKPMDANGCVTDAFECIRMPTDAYESLMTDTRQYYILGTYVHTVHTYILRIPYILHILYRLFVATVVKYIHMYMCTYIRFCIHTDWIWGVWGL